MRESQGWRGRGEGYALGVSAITAACTLFEFFEKGRGREGGGDGEEEGREWDRQSFYR